MIKAVTRRKDAANPAYLSRFHLRQAPFGPGTAPAFFCADPVRERYLNMLLHLTQYSEELLLVTGEPGMGKSALLEKYVSRADDHWQVCRIVGGASSQPDALFLHIAQCFKLDLSQVAADRLLDALRDHLGRLQQQMTPVLTIDDAHLLADDALEIALRLAELQGETGRLVRVVLFAEPTLLPRLAMERFQGIPEPHRFALEALDEEQTGAYLNHRLRAAGYSGTTPYTPKQVKRIHKESRGVPAAINRAAHRLLDEAVGGGSAGLRFAIPAAVWKTAAGGLVFGLLVLAARDELVRLLGGTPAGAPQARLEESPGGPILRPPERSDLTVGGLAMVLRQGERLFISCGSAVAAEPVPGERPLSPVPPPEPAPAEPPRAPAPNGAPPAQVTPPPPPPLPLEPEPEPEPEPLSRPLIQPLNEPLPEVPEAPTDPARSEPAPFPPETPPVAPSEPSAELAEPPAATVPPSAPEPVPPAIHAVEPSTITGSRSPQTVTLRGERLAPVGNVALTWSGGAKVLDPSQVTAVGPERLDLQVTTGVNADTWVAQVTAPDGRRSNVARFTVVPPAPVSVPAPALPSAEPSSALGSAATLQDAAWVRARVPAHHTIQLLAAANPDTLAAYVREHRLPSPAAAVAVERGGKQLHLLVFGDFADRAAADRALAALPKAVRDAGPWVRTFASLQSELAPAPAAAPAEPKDSAWLWSQPPTHYAVQLAVMRERAGLDALLAAASGDVPVAVATFARGGQTHFALFYGSFPAKEAAVAAIDRLPAPLRAGGTPWARPFADIHDSLSLNGD